MTSQTLRVAAETGHLPEHHTDWLDAHTDYTRPPLRRGPAGLAQSETQWRTRLVAGTPNGWLLANNSMTRTLASGSRIHLMHTTVALDAIRASGKLYVSSGCLVAALYCAPLIPEPGGLRPHNLAAYLLDTKAHTRTLVIEIDPDGPVPAAGIDYLRLGPIHLRAYLTHRSYLSPAEDSQLCRAVVHQISATAPFFDTMLANATGDTTPPSEFCDQLAAAIPDFPFLGYLYFEVLSEYLMLHSTNPQTIECAGAGELNNWLYKQLAFRAVAGMDQLFDLARFHPRHDRLIELIGAIEPGLQPDVARYVRDRLSHLFATIALDQSQDASAVTFRGATDFDSLAAISASLLGQAVFRQMRFTPRYPQLYLTLEEAKALEAWDYWNHTGIPTPFNGFLPKGEIGVNPAYPRARYTIWLAERCEQGLVHPVEQIDATFVPRLAELGLTAMRRDHTGKAAGHRRPTRHSAAGTANRPELT